MRSLAVNSSLHARHIIPGMQAGKHTLMPLTIFRRGQQEERLAHNFFPAVPINFFRTLIPENDRPLFINNYNRFITGQLHNRSKTRFTFLKFDT